MATKINKNIFSSELQHAAGERAERVERATGVQHAAGLAQHAAGAGQRKRKRGVRSSGRCRSHGAPLQAIRPSENEPDGGNPGADFASAEKLYPKNF
jgi:hypothetical protein